MYTSFPNTHTKAVCALENGPGIPICKIQNCQIMVKKWQKTKISTKNEKKWGAMKKMKKKWKNEKKNKEWAACNKFNLWANSHWFLI